ncbi:LpqB family beta-propeller domain-containing protein [Arthrobacter sp.]|uniref:LpqB family beta-propeller domain-containing protein n=1 Tax=Arthrobacter sp. TaxID=1667 RepID=UPI00258C9E66|nr:LpqB family beta-propeller domain-containing protein [Arthrobacter sp.]
MTRIRCTTDHPVAARKTPAVGAVRHALGHARRRGAPRVRSALALLLAVVVLLTAGACASIPRSGPVSKSQGDSAPQVKDPQVFYPPDPTPGASEDSIIEGFYNAGNSYKDDYKVARLYLAQNTATTWKPETDTLVYRSAKVVPGAKDREFFYDLDLAYEVDAQGIVTTHPKGTHRRVPLSLAKVDGEWRITQVGDGTVIPLDVFQRLYDPYTLYFYDPSFRYAVPDVRWFLTRSTTPTSIVRAILAGPAPHLKGAVVSAFPEGTRLAKDSVPIVSGTAQVDLTAGLLQSSVTDRHRMLNQLTIALRAPASVVNVQLLAGSTALTMDGSDSVVPPILNATVPSWQVSVLQKQLGIYDNNKAERVKGLDTAAYNPRNPAVSYTQDSFAFLNQQRSALYMATAGKTVKDVLDGSELLRPSFDPQGWVWSGNSGTADGKLIAFNSDNAFGPAPPASVSLAPDWLRGQVVKDAQLSRDGTRILILTGKGEGTKVLIAGVIRGADGTPRGLTTPLQLSDGKNVTQGAWVSDTQVLVANTSGSGAESPLLLSLRSFQSQSLSDVVGLRGISVGNGIQDIYVQTATGLAQRVGNTWVQQGAGVKDPKFAG